VLLPFLNGSFADNLKTDPSIFSDKASFQTKRLEHGFSQNLYQTIVQIGNLV
jgi:hypothetical protein